MAITSTIRKREPEKVNFQAIRGNKDYFEVRLGDYLTNSWISGVFFHKTCVEAIMNWSLESVKERLPSQVDEVGGYLLGGYTVLESGEYELAINHFCPAKADAQSPSHLKLGSEANIHLAKMMDDYPGNVLLGWFHTHPGHTPYLSDIDLKKTHELFYTRSYQVAIVLDTLTKGFDTGIFSRKQNGKVNNKADFKPWLSWKTIASHFNKMQ
jgi:proteasome lid subunit RPN8/RPN11